MMLTEIDDKEVSRLNDMDVKVIEAWLNGDDMLNTYDGDIPSIINVVNSILGSSNVREDVLYKVIKYEDYLLIMHLLKL